MKHLHRDDLFGWSQFDTARDLDFNSVVWVRPGGNVAVDPLPLCEHDLDQLRELGGLDHIVITTSDHLRAGVELAAQFAAGLIGPAAEAATMPASCARFVSEGDSIVPGLRVYCMDGSKTPGELALVLEQTTLITGDLVRGQHGGRLNLLPDARLTDPEAARASVRRLGELTALATVLVGDGWHLWRDAAAALRALSG
jgi:hypothetical protein